MTAHKTVAVISCYRPGREFARNVGLAASQTDEVIIVDDGSGPTWTSVLDELDSRPDTTVLRHAENSGIARTLNDGVDVAIARGASHVLFLDQDSALPDGFVTSLHSLLRDASSAGLAVGVVAPWKVNDHESRKPGAVVQGFQLREEPIQSGQLMPVETWRLIGRFREDFFIDAVDTEYFLRLQDAGLVAVFDRALNLPHSLGAAVEASVLGRTVRVGGRPLPIRVHPPLRTYYIYRNGVVLARERLRTNPRFVGRWLVGMVKRSILSIGLGPGKLQQLRATFLGTIDGLVRRSGKASRSFSTRTTYGEN
jgi:rhamnosyltransferase